MLTLILGGARSGKSDLALRLAAASGRDVLFVATMEPGDDELRLRIEQHRAERPGTWRTVEAPRDIAPAVAAHARPGDFVVMDCLTLWVSNLLIDRLGGGDDERAAAAAPVEIAALGGELAEWAVAFEGEVAVVSNEVGMGVVPVYPLGRAFRDALGAANAAVAAHADRVYVVAAGLVVELKSLGAQPLDAFGRRPVP